MSSTIGNAVLSYDVNSKHIEVKDALKAKGYFDIVTLNKVTYALPSTTVWKQNTSTDAALNDVRSVCSRLGVALYSAVSVIANDWAAFAGQIK